MLEFFIPLITCFAATALFGMAVLPMLKKLKARQVEREEGPQSHKAKTGTPTMGGIMFLIPWIAVTAFYLPTHRNLMPVMVATVGFALIGFVDDFIKVVLKRNLGLKPYQKFGLQIILSLIICVLIMNYTNVSFDMRVPFSSIFTDSGTPVTISLGLFAIPFEIIALCGTVNGSNFTDGLDGLASFVTAVIAIFMAAASMITSSGITPAASAMIGGLLGFLIYNKHPAKVFMGDTGSLALGGFVASSAIMMNLPIYIIIVAFVYVAEVCSVIIQVTYFKATGGKRFFKMAPIHHHFELLGWSEVKVTTVFTLATFVLVLLGIVAI